MSTQQEPVNENTTTDTTATGGGTETTTVQQMLSALVEMASQQAQQTREMHRNLKKLVLEVDREHKRLQKTSRPRRTVTQKPVQVAPAMKKFLKSNDVKESDGGFTRQVMMKAVSAYIKKEDLQLESNRKSWKADSTLVSLFGLDAKETYTFMNINGLLSRVVKAKESSKSKA